VYFVRLLFDELPIFLVEPWPFRWSCGFITGVSLPCW